jgi:effector-binding domain-containing protein
MLLMKHAQAEQRLAEEQGRLSRIAARLKQIELEDSMTPYDVLLKTAPAMYIASQRVTIPTNDQVPEYLTPTIDAVYRHVQNAGGKDAGACFVIWHQSSQVLIDEVAEAAVPLERPIAPSEQVGVYELPATSVASTIHRGDYAGFAQAHAALLSAIEANGWESDGTYREVYLVFDPSDPANHVTEVQYPLRAGR